MDERKIKDFFQRWGEIKDAYIWRGMIDINNKNHLEESTFKYFKDMHDLIKEYEDDIKKWMKKRYGNIL